MLKFLHVITTTAQDIFPVSGGLFKLTEQTVLIMHDPKEPNKCKESHTLIGIIMFAADVDVYD